MRFESPPSYSLAAGMEVLAAVPELRQLAPGINYGYPYWSKFKHKYKGEAAQLGITPAQLWQGIKAVREMSPQWLYALQEGTLATRFRLSVSLPQLAQRLHLLDRNLGRLDALDKHHDARKLELNAVMEEAIASSQIEGATTTRLQAKELLRANRKPRNESERMVLNNYLGMNYIVDICRQPLTLANIMELHRILTRETLPPVQAGRLRSSNGVVVVDAITDEVVHQPPDFQALPQLMEQLIAFANEGYDNPESFLHPFLRAAVLHFFIGYIHPFHDGNGRTARALFYWCLLHNGYPLIEYMPISRLILNKKGKYRDAYLHTELDQNDLTYFCLFKLDVVEQAYRELLAYLDRKRQEREQYGQLIRQTQFNLRQTALLADLLDHKHRGGLGYREYANMQAVVYQTARTDLMALAEAGLLQVKRIGKQDLYFPADDFEVKLRKLIPGIDRLR